MNIGIIVFSITGNTLSVCKKIKTKLEKNGHKVTLEEIKVTGDYPKDKTFELKTIPSIEQYDVVIFATFVEAFSLNRAFKTYLKELNNLKYKKTLCFVTQHFPYPWMGGNNTIRQMKKILKEKKAIILDTGVINWSNKEREKMIDQLVLRFNNLF